MFINNNNNNNIFNIRMSNLVSWNIAIIHMNYLFNHTWIPLQALLRSCKDLL